MAQNHDSDQQNWEDFWQQEEFRWFRKKTQILTSEEPYFKSDSSTYSSRQIFFGAAVIYFFARLISPIINRIRRWLTNKHDEKTVSPLAETDSTIILKASAKLMQREHIVPCLLKQAKQQEVYKEKFEDEGVVYRP